MSGHLRAVGPPSSVDDLPVYPISSKERLDSHFFVPWNIKRFRKSDFKRLADPDVGWFGFLLFLEAHDESPVGTLPTDDRLLAHTLHLPLDRWQALCQREVNPLRGWERVRCDNGEIRLAHKVVTEVALVALESKRKSEADQEARLRAKRVKDLAVMIETKIRAPQVLKAEGMLDRFNDWLEDRHPAKQRREPFIRRALEEFLKETGRF